MATITRYVNTNSTAGGDGTTNGTAGATRAYATFIEWEAAEETDLVTDGDIHVVYLDGAGGDDSTASLNRITGWTTGASNGITCQQNSAGSPYTLSSNNNDGPLQLAEDYITCDGFTVEGTATGKTGIATHFATFTASDNNLIIRNMVSKRPSALTSHHDYSFNSTNLVLDMENCLGFSGGRVTDTRNCATATISYCTFFRLADSLGMLNTGESTIKNTYCGRSSGTQNDYWTTSPNGSNNVSSDTTAESTFTSSHNSKAPTDQFVSLTGGSEDFHLKSGSFLEGEGTTVLGITTDFEGDTRDVSTPDVGYDEYISVGGGATGKSNPMMGPFGGPLAGPIG